MFLVGVRYLALLPKLAQILTSVRTYLVALLSFERALLIGGPELADRAETADHIHKDSIDRYAPCLQALLFARPIINIADCYYYCVVLTILNVIPDGITCIY